MIFRAFFSMSNGCLTSTILANTDLMLGSMTLFTNSTSGDESGILNDSLWVSSGFKVVVVRVRATTANSVLYILLICFRVSKWSTGVTVVRRFCILSSMIRSGGVSSRTNVVLTSWLLMTGSVSSRMVWNREVICVISGFLDRANAGPVISDMRSEMMLLMVLAESLGMLATKLV